MTQHIELDLSSDSLQEVHQAVHNGEYSSASEVVEQAVRDWSRRRSALSLTERIGQAWDEAIADDSPGEDPEVVFARLRNRYQTGQVIQS